MLTRVQATTKVTLTHTFTVDEIPQDAGGAVTVTVKRLDASAVASGAASHDATGVYSFALPVSAVVDTWTVDWAGSFGGVTVTARDFVEVVGGFIFGIGEARKEHSIPPKYDTATLARKRIEVEQECEDICHRAWVPRFARFLLDGSGTDELVVPDMYVRAVRAVSVAASYGSPLVAYTSDQLAAVAPLPSGVLALGNCSTWPRGRRNVLVEYEFGGDFPPESIRSNAMLRLKSILERPSSGVPSRAVSFTVADGGVYRLTLPGRDSTGIPDIDAAYQRAGEPKVWIA